MRLIQKLSPALILGFLLVATASNARAHDDVDAAFCARIVARVDQIQQLDPLHDCMEFYYHNGRHENPPGSFNHTIRLGYRILELDSSDEDTTSTVVWLLYSKYATWRKNPEWMPDGATKLDEALALMHRGLANNPQSANLPLTIGHIFEGLVKFYHPEKAPLLFMLYERANLLAQDDRTRIRARLDLGHAHRKYGTCADALHWYREVLRVDSANAVALREIGKLACAR